MTLLFNDCKSYPVRLTGRSKQQDNKTKNKSWACTVRVRLEIHSRPTLTGLFTLRGSKDTRTCRWRLLLQDERKNQREPSSSNRWRASSGSQGKAEVSPTSKSVGTTETEDTGISIILKSVCVCGCVCTRVQETTVQITMQSDLIPFFFLSFTAGCFYHRFCVVMVERGLAASTILLLSKKKRGNK